MTIFSNFAVCVNLKKGPLSTPPPANEYAKHNIYKGFQKSLPPLKPPRKSCHISTLQHLLISISFSHTNGGTGPCRTSRKQFWSPLKYSPYRAIRKAVTMGYTPEWEPMNTSASAIISRSARYSRTNWRSGGFFNFTRVLKGDDIQQTNCVVSMRRTAY